MTTSNQDLIKILTGPTITLILFFTTNVIQMFVKLADNLNVRRRVIIGLYKEICDNLQYGIKFLDDKDIETAIKNKIKADDQAATIEKRQPLYRPLVGITESSRFYDAIAASLPNLRRECLIAITDYYRSVTDQKQAAEAIQGPSFLCISVDSRCSTIEDLWKAFRESSERGKIALFTMEKLYPRRWFKGLKP